MTYKCEGMGIKIDLNTVKRIFTTNRKNSVKKLL